MTSLLQRVLDGMPIGALAIAPDLTIAATNASAATLLGVDPGELAPGRPIESVVRGLALRGDYGDGEVETATGRVLSEIRRAGAATFDQRTPAGTLLAVSLTSIEPERLMTFEDTARKEAEAVVEEARRTADRANQAKSEFLANMSHELRAPLNAIVGYTGLLKKDAKNRGQASTLADLARIDTAAKHLQRLINDMLDLSKTEAGRMEVFIEPVTIPTLVEEVRALVSPLALGNGSVLHVSVDRTVDRIQTDYPKLKRSLLNLLGNACKFTRNGTVALEVERRTAEGGEGAAEDALLFRIRDSGIGMTEEQTQRLFQPFTQADSSRTRQFGGIGLGLAVTRRFCRLLGGDVLASSTVGQGSTFTIVLPVTPAASAPAGEGRTARRGAGVDVAGR